MKKAIFLIFSVCFVFSCQKETISIAEVDEAPNHAIPGSWLLVEYGYSPGDKYYKVPVSADPPRIITLESDFTMSSMNMEMEMYRYYRLLSDTVADRQVIAFFEEDPGDGPLDLASLSPTYFTHWQDNYLNLNYRWCIEGCHLKFKRIPSGNTE